jgi:type IV pilus assembly protein PilQ
MNVNILREFVADISKTPPDIQSREAKTKVSVRNGQTAVIGGIYNSDMQNAESGVPWLRSIPVLGWLFKSKNFRTQKTELLLFLTPRIINAENSIPQESTLQ